MLLDSEENINKVDWFISKKDGCIHGLYKEHILYDFHEEYNKNYRIYYIDSKNYNFSELNNNLIKIIKQKKLTEYDSVNQYIKIYNRNKIINNLIND